MDKKLRCSNRGTGHGEEPHDSGLVENASCVELEISKSCAQKRSPGWGIAGLLQNTCLPWRLLHALPDNISYEEGALTEPAANAVQDVLKEQS